MKKLNSKKKRVIPEEMDAILNTAKTQSSKNPVEDLEQFLKEKYGENGAFFILNNSTLKLDN